MVVPIRLASVVVVVVVALSCSSLVYATPMQMNPVTPVGLHLALTPSHPAYGAEVGAEASIAPVESRASIEDLVMEIMELSGGAAGPGSVTVPNEAAMRRSTRKRRLETSSADIQRLEQHFQTPMERNVMLLPTSGAAPTTPWPSSYWPVYADGINAQWDAGKPSPAQKYATAYGLNAVAFQKKVSQFNGILSLPTRKPCKTKADCGPLKDGSECAKRKGEGSGVCIPAWFGLCHAWAPAAILETEPKCPVTIGSTTFQPFDIKALLTEIYDGAAVETVFTGARFDGKDDEPDNKDEYGRFRDAARRDLGAGFFHVAVANILGFRNQSFIVDVAAGVEVWNQPVQSYEIVETKEMTPDDAAWEFFKTSTYPFNPVVQKIMYVKNRFKWVVEAGVDGSLVPTGRAEAFVRSADHEYLLELDDLGNIIGGEWVSTSMTTHPDFLWFPVAKPALDTISRVGLSYHNVSDLLTASITATC